MLKKAQRDCGQTVRSTAATLFQGLERELDAAFRNFQVAVLRKEVDLCIVRETYCSMDPRDVVRLIFTKIRQLYQMVFNIQISWDTGHQGVGMTAAERKKHQKTLKQINKFVTNLATNELLQKIFKVFSIYLCLVILVIKDILCIFVHQSLLIVSMITG